MAPSSHAALCHCVDGANKPVSAADFPQACAGAADWFLAYTKPRQEAIAHRQFLNQGYDAYLPVYKTLKRTAEGMQPLRGPMFPRYVFFRPGHAGQSIAPARSTVGVACVVRFGITLATVSPDLIQGLRSFEAEREQAQPAQLLSLRAGQRVAICSGPLKGLEGLVCATASERVTVLLELMGRQPQVTFPHHHLEVRAA